MRSRQGKYGALSDCNERKGNSGMMEYEIKSFSETRGATTSILSFLSFKLRLFVQNIITTAKGARLGDSCGFNVTPVDSLIHRILFMSRTEM
jgi:hypothetical protein